MGADSKIEWTHHTFNPWWGCAKISPGCEHCYAEAFSRRVGHRVWGLMTPRRFFGAKHWQEPRRWNDAAVKAGERRRVFCASMADVFEDRLDLIEARAALWTLIEETPALDWLLLTKRPENLGRFLPWATGENVLDHEPGPWPNVWIGTTVEDQKRADQRIPLLLKVPAAVRFLSCEPLLEGIDLTAWLTTVPSFAHALAGAIVDTGITEREAMDAIARLRSDRGEVSEDSRIDWVIVGGESGHGARRFNVEWARSIVGQCRVAGVPVLVKQMGAHVVDRNDRFDTAGDSEDPRDWPWAERDPLDVEHDINGFREEYQGALVRLRLLDSKGGDWSEWPEILRVREYPTPRRP